MLGGPARKPLAILLAPTALLWLWTAAAAQDINPDRPDLTTSAEVVPAGALQIETGLEYERARVGGGPTERRLSGQGVLRLGLTSALEISLEGEPFVWLRATEDDHGSGDYTLGFKYRFHAPSPDHAGPALAIKPFVKVPAAREPIGSERTDFGALLLMTLGLPSGPEPRRQCRRRRDRPAAARGLHPPGHRLGFALLGGDRAALHDHGAVLLDEGRARRP